MDDRFAEPKQSDKDQTMEAGRASLTKTASAYPSARFQSIFPASLWNVCLLALMLALMPGIAGAQTPPGMADLSVTISASNTVAVVGEEVTFTATYVNNGPDSASDVHLSFTSETNGWEYVSGATTSGTLVTDSSRPWAVVDEVEFPVLAPGDSVVLTIVLKPTIGNYLTTCYAGIAANYNVTADPVWQNDNGSTSVMAVRQGATLWDMTSKAFVFDPSQPENPTGQLYVNEDATFEVTVLNRGPVEATSVTLTNTLYNLDTFYQNQFPATGMSNLWTEVVTSGSVAGAQVDGINLTIQSIAPGSSVVFRMTYTLSEANIYLLESTATIPHEITDEPEQTSFASIEVLAGPRPPNADLSIVTTADRTAVPFGEDTVVRVAVTNNGPAPAYDVVALFQAVVFKFRVDIISVESTAGTPEEFVSGSIIDQGWKLSLPVLNPGQTETMTLVFRQTKFEEIRAGSYVIFDSTRSLDPNDDNNGMSLTLTTIGEPPVFDLQASITASPATAQPGGLLVYNMAVTNAGPDDLPTTITLSNQWAKITYPQWGPNGPIGPLIVEDGDVEFRSIQDSGQWTLNINEQGLMASLPFLAAGETANLVLVYSVSPDAVGDELGNINNSIAIRSNLNETNTDNNGAIVSTPITTAGGSSSDLYVTQTASSQRAALNQPMSYSVTALNLGPNPTNAAYVGYLVPGGATLTSITSDKGTPVVVSNFGSISDVPLAVGEAVTMTVNVMPTQLGQLDSYSAGSSNVFDPDVVNNYSAQSILVVDTLPVDDPPVVIPPVDVPCTEPVDLSAQMLKIRKKGKMHKKTGEWKFQVQAKVAVTNIGSECAPHTVVKLYLSDDLMIDPSDLLLGTKTMKQNCPGKKGKAKAKKVNFKMKLEPGVNPTGRYLIAVADGDNIVPECKEANNNVAAF